jgi:hypothetical protein
LRWTHHLFPWEAHLEPEDNLEREKIAEYQRYQQQQAELLRRERGG